MKGKALAVPDDGLSVSLGEQVQEVKPCVRCSARTLGFSQFSEFGLRSAIEFRKHKLAPERSSRFCKEAFCLTERAFRNSASHG